MIIQSDDIHTINVLCYCLQLEEVLANSDRAMAIVKDMFGDNPQVSAIL